MSNSSHPEYSIPSIIAIIAAIWSFCAGAGFGFILAIMGILFGVLGVILATLPSVRGGVMSVFSIFAGLAGIIAAFLKLLF